MCQFLTAGADRVPSTVDAIAPSEEVALEAFTRCSG